jgi:hypothetical protein
MTSADATADAGPAAAMERFETLEDRPAFGGAAFGRVGAYRYISARAHILIRRTHPANRLLVDLDLAPRTAEDEVRYAADVMILRPNDPRAASRLMVAEVPNRGLRLLLPGMLDLDPMAQFMAPPAGGAPSQPFSAPADAGAGFLLRRGYTLVWVGWQADLPAAGAFMRADLPVASDGGAPIHGRVQAAAVFDSEDQNLVLPLAYPAAEGREHEATLTFRTRPGDRPTAVSPSRWRFTDALHVQLERPDEAEAGAIYEFVYTATRPIVAGLGLTAFRDVLGFLRRGERDQHGGENPLGDLSFDHAIGLGSSQSGRYLRDVLWHGFNDDGAGAPVFDGLIVNVAGSRRTFTNRRWAEPGRFSRQHEDRLVFGNQFPFAYQTTTDPLTGARDGVLARCEARGTSPKIFHVDGGAEFWNANASLVAHDGAGRDLGFPPNVRGYLIAGAPHAPGMVNASSQLPPSPLRATPVLRALLVDMEQWLSGEAEPPPSRWPSQALGALAPPAAREAVGFPAFTAMPYAGAANEVVVTDYDQVPAAADPVAAWATLVPVTDADGNDRAGVRVPEIAAPKGTYLGWNPRKPGYGEGDLSFVFGAYVPFAETRAERIAAGDPRLSLEERYADEADWRRQYEAAKAMLKEERLYLDGDA